MSRGSSARLVTVHKRIWRMEPQEEFIWSMRIHRASEIVSDEESASASDETETVDIPDQILARSVYNIYSLKSQRQVLLFASFLPDVALSDLNDYEPRQIEGCLVYGRISGLHQLIDRYHNMKPDFKIKLTAQLNEFVGALVQEILFNGGDILKFSPTTIVAFWKCTRWSDMTHNVHVALNCTIVIQKNYGKFALEAGEKLTVDFAINAGSVYFCLIGDETVSTYIVCGMLYEDLRKARKEITLQNTIVAPNAMQYIHSFEYVLEKVEGYAYFQVIGLTKMWKQVRKDEYHDDMDVHLSGRVAAASISTMSLNPSKGSLVRQGSTNEFYLRPKMVDIIDNSDFYFEHILKFFQKGIREGILENQPVDNFVELREVSVLSIKVETSIPESKFMLKLTSKIYKIISRFVEHYLGFIYYVTTHDNKAFFSICFGLKSCAHVMQQRSALKCAYQIMSSLKTIDNINTITIGVSTGKIYFTMIGHPLRQDLTLFGRTVLTATNLSGAFNSRIVCDQDTFLHSKMHADCFNLISREQIRLVEEISCGSIYELMSDEMNLSDEIPLYDHPAIGRDKEINIFKELLTKFIDTSRLRKRDRTTHTALYIRAYPKEGKTRLIHEMIRVTPSDIPVHYISLQAGNEEVPFSFVRKFFSILFGDDMLSLKQEDREEKLQASLENFPKGTLAWALNPVFDVNFPKSEETENYSSEERFDVLSEILTYLCLKIFSNPWLVAVDDTDYLDEESWKVLEILHESGIFFLLMTSNRDLSLRVVRRPSFSGNTKVMRIKVEELSPNYVGAIACQHFKAVAISHDLEYVLQKKSNGNIGFIKNLLTNLYHRGYIYTREMTYHEIADENLVPQSLVLLMPMTEGVKNHLRNMIARKGKYDKNEFKRVLWFLFVESMQSKKIYDMRQAICNAIFKTEKMRVCFLKKNLVMRSIPEDLIVSIRITQLFEMLTYPEQMILKCCSALGDCFSRMVLEHVLTIDYYALLAPAIQSFFEMSILCCGRGDFTEGAQFSVIREKCVDPQFDDELSCKCRAIFQERYRNLPEYAYCGFLRFKQPRFRQIIYDQLRQSQKIECHAKVIMFLHEETKRCRSCGRDAFNWDTKKRLDDYGEDMRKELLLKRYAKSSDRDFDSLSSPMHGLFYDDKPPSPQIHKYSSVKSGSFMSLDFSIRGEHNSAMTTDKSEIYSVKKVFGPMHVLKASTNVSLVRSFSTSDFTCCECPQILSTYYRDMIVHCRGAGQYTKLYDNMQKYAYLCIQNKNISEAQNVLKQAYPCINDIFEMSKPPPKWKRKLFEGKLSTISALALMELGLYDDALLDVHIALSKFQIKMPRSNIGKILSLIKGKLKRLLTFFAFPEMHTKSLSSCRCEYFVDVAEALNLFGKLLMKKNKWKLAELASSWALYKALTAQTDFSIICECFSNMIMISIHNKKRYMCDALQVHALRFCYRKMNRVESWELAAVCRLYSSIMIGKFVRCQTDFGIHLGYIIIKIGASLNDSRALLMMSSTLINLLLSKLHLHEAYGLLLEMEYCSEDIDDHQVHVWFYSQALLFHMNTGYSIVPYQQCVSIFDSNLAATEDSEFIAVHRRLAILMWLWCLRNKQWESASFFNEFIEASLEAANDSPKSIANQIFILEGFLLLYVDKLNKSNIWEAKKLHKSIRRSIRFLSKESKFFIAIIPRLCLLRTYYYHIKHNDKKFSKWIVKTKKQARKCNNNFIQEWTKYLEKAWAGELTRKTIDFWRDHCEDNNLFFYQQFDENVDAIGYYTLPTPRYL